MRVVKTRKSQKILIFKYIIKISKTANLKSCN
jgi:hypothetical protein